MSLYGITKLQLFNGQRIFEEGTCYFEMGAVTADDLAPAAINKHNDDHIWVHCYILDFT